MIVYFYWNGLILNIRFYFQYLFLIQKFIFAAISYFLLVWYSSEESRITQLYSGFGPCRFWVLKCWRMPKAHDCWHSRKIHSEIINICWSVYWNKLLFSEYTICFKLCKHFYIDTNVYEFTHFFFLNLLQNSLILFFFYF